MSRPPGITRRTLRRFADCKGSSVVEFGLSAAIFFSLLFGVMLMSIALYSYHYISEAAREGVRYAVVRGSNAATYGGLATASNTDIQTFVRGIGFPGIKSTNLTVTTSWSLNCSTWSQTSTGKNLPNDYVKVNVKYTLPLAIPFLSSRTLTMNSTAVGVISD
jgi:Flp pilus assembly protein TadG